MIGMTEWSAVIMRAQDAINDLGRKQTGVVVAVHQDGDLAVHAAGDEALFAFTALQMLAKLIQMTPDEANRARYQAAWADLSGKPL